MYNIHARLVFLITLFDKLVGNQWNINLENNADVFVFLNQHACRIQHEYIHCAVMLFHDSHFNH